MPGEGLFLGHINKKLSLPGGGNRTPISRVTGGRTSALCVLDGSMYRECTVTHYISRSEPGVLGPTGCILGGP